MAKAISVRLDDDAERALRTLEASGMTQSEAIRTSLLESADRLRRKRVLGLAEMMNFPGVVSGSESELAKLRLDGASHVDGHAPSLLGKGVRPRVAGDYEAWSPEN